jgi:hypothetical protein
VRTYGTLAEEFVAFTGTLLLVTNTTVDQRDTSLTDMLHNQLPWAQRIADPADRAKPTAIDRAEHHLASTTDTSTAAQQAPDLLTRRDQLAAPTTTSPTTVRAASIASGTAAAAPTSALIADAPGSVLHFKQRVHRSDRAPCLRETESRFVPNSYYTATFTEMQRCGHREVIVRFDPQNNDRQCLA